MIEGLDERLLALPRERTQALPALHVLHGVAGYLSLEGLREVAAWLHIPESDLYQVATSYTEFRLEPSVPGAVRVCRGLTCQIAGSERLAEELRAAGRTVERCECLFLCAVAPVVESAGRVQGRAGVDRVSTEAAP